MADQIPIKRHLPEDGLAEFTATDSVGIANGGTGASTLLTAKTNLEIITSVALINTQPHVVFFDTIRFKNLSTSMMNYLWAEAAIGNTEWIQIAHATHSRSAHVMPFDGTIVGIAAHCENTVGLSRPIDLDINGTAQALFTIPNGGINSQVTDNTIDIDFIQNDRIRLRANGAGGQIQDTVISLFIRWRGA